MRFYFTFVILLVSATTIRGQYDISILYPGLGSQGSLDIYLGWPPNEDYALPYSVKVVKGLSQVYQDNDKCCCPYSQPKDGNTRNNINRIGRLLPE